MSWSLVADALGGNLPVPAVAAGINFTPQYLPYQTHNTKSIEEFLPAASDSLRCSFVSFTLSIWRLALALP